MATTYTDQNVSLNALTDSIVFSNGVRAITGTTLNTNEIGQNDSSFANLVAYDNYSYKVVRTYATDAANGQSLRDAYADAVTLTPGGNPLSVSNRVALLLPPGTYALGSTGLTMGTQFVDLIGLGRADETIITSVSNTDNGVGTITQTTNDIKFRNLTIQNTAAAYSTGTDTDDSGYAPQGVYPSTEFTDCIFFNPGTGGDGAPFMRLGVEYGGTYQRCRGIDGGSGISVFFAIASGNYFDCHTSVNGFGYLGEASGIFTDSSCLDGFGFGADATGSFTRCTAFNSGFGSGGNASGTFNLCTALTDSYGWGDGVSCSGIFTSCKATTNSFGNSTNISIFTNCTSGDNSFGSVVDTNDSVLDGTYTNCIGGDNCFFGFGSFAPTCTLSGSFNGCIAGNGSFCGSSGSAIITGRFENCTAGDESFGYGSASITSATFLNCNAGNNSFGYNQCILTTSSFVNCSAGDNSFGWAEFPGSTSSMFGGEFINCNGGDKCWAWLDPTDEAKFVGCSAGASSFLADAPGTAYYENCTALGTNGIDGGSFNNTSATGVMVNCHVLTQGTDGAGFYECGGTYIGCSATTGFVIRDGDLANFTDCHVTGSGFNAGNIQASYDVSANFTNCSAGDNSFVFNTSSPIPNSPITISGTFRDCHAGDNSFGCTNGDAVGILFTGKAYNCTAGNYSFCTTTASPIAGTHTEVMSGYLENCHAGPGSFAAASTATKTGTLSGCTVRAIGLTPSVTDAGVLTGTMINCQWTTSPAGDPALLVATGAKVYGGLYRAGAGATAGISSSGVATVSIANVLVNQSLGGSITNNITSPNVIVDTDI